MWLLLPCCFVSVVEDEDDPLRLVVRARVKSDLDALRSRYMVDLGPTRVTAERDYFCRASIGRDAFAAGLARAVADLHYTNFKNAVAVEQGRIRSGLYAKIWGLLRELQRDHTR